MAVRAADLEEPVIDVPDRLRKSREHCGIKSAEKMAELLTPKLVAGGYKAVKGSTVSAWEAGTNQPTRTIRMADLVPLWVDVCNEHGAPLGRSTSAEFVYGLRTGRFAHLAIVGGDVTGQGILLDHDLAPVPFFERPQLTTV